MIRVILPQHLRALANTAREISVDVIGPPTMRSLIDALEAKYPVLTGTIREHGKQERRKLVRFFACEEDLSHLPLETPLPQKVVDGAEAFYIIGAIAGG